MTLQHCRSAHQFLAATCFEATTGVSRLLFRGNVWAQWTADVQCTLEDQVVFIHLELVASSASVQAVPSSYPVVLAVACELQVDLRQVWVETKAEDTSANAVAV